MLGRLRFSTYAIVSTMLDMLSASCLNALRGYGDFGMLLLIWLVQLIIYPSFRWADPIHFKRWHYLYTGLISLFVGPLILCQVAVYAWLLVSGWANGIIAWDIGINATLLVINCIATAVWSVPCHDRLQKLGYDRATIDRLVVTNWLRTAGWTAMYFVDLTHALRGGSAC